MNTTTLKAFFSASIGTVIEYYDYALISFFLPILAPLFFPAETAYQSLVKGYYIILVAMIARPLGGLFFGYIGDTAGRRTALLSSMYGIALATFAIGIIPTYASIGVWAIIAIAIAKAIQAFCFGGEFNGAGIYVVEHVQNKQEGLAGSLLTSITLSGSLVASLLGILLTSDFMPDWSWRLAFIFGGFISLLGILYRKSLIESPQFKPATEHSLPIMVMIKRFPRELLAAMFMGGFAVISFATTITFITPVFMAEGLINAHELMFLESGLTLLGMLALVPIGLIADKFSPQKVLIYGSWALTIFGYPLLYLIDSHKVVNLVFASSCLIIINEMVVGPTHAFLKNLFPMGYRYRGSAFGYCIGMSLFGGVTPLVESYLYSYTNHFTAISLWLAFIGLGTLFSIHNAVSRKAPILAEIAG
jgi:MHS family proline/betaine transporter-like MFS transporter